MILCYHKVLRLQGLASVQMKGSALCIYSIMMEFGCTGGYLDSLNALLSRAEAKRDYMGKQLAKNKSRELRQFQKTPQHIHENVKSSLRELRPLSLPAACVFAELPICAHFFHKRSIVAQSRATFYE